MTNWMLKASPNCGTIFFSIMSMNVVPDASDFDKVTWKIAMYVKRDWWFFHTSCCLDTFRSNRAHDSKTWLHTHPLTEFVWSSVICILPSLFESKKYTSMRLVSSWIVIIISSFFLGAHIRNDVHRSMNTCSDRFLKSWSVTIGSAVHFLNGLSQDISALNSEAQKSISNVARVRILN